MLRQDFWTTFLSNFTGYLLVIFILTIFGGFFSINASAEMPQEVRAKMQAANADLDMMAQEVAKLCSAPGFRGFLRSEIAKSKNRENILELDKFLDRAQKQKGMPPGLSKTKNSAIQAKGRLKSSGLFEIAGYDLYIPVEAHKKKWRGGDDFLVAFRPVDDEKDVKKIVAYSVRDGKRVFLDPNKAPGTVVLVIAPEEHETHDLPQGKVTKKLQIPPENPKANFMGDEMPPRKGEKELGGGNSSIGIKFLKIYEDGESWAGGLPEIYTMILTAKATSNGNQCLVFRWNNCGVDRTNVWYQTWPREYISWPGRCYTVNYPSISTYFDNSFYKTYAFYIYESDGSKYRNDFLYQIVPGATCKVYRKKGDDKIASAKMYRYYFDYNYDYSQKMTNAYVVWRKVH